MDDKRNEAVTEEDDWSDLFGVSYFDDEPEAESPEENSSEENPSEESEEETSDEETAEEVEETAEDAEEPDSDPESEPGTDEEDTGEDDPEEEEDEGGAEEVGTQDPKPADDAAEILEAIRKVDPAIESFNDLEDVGLFALLLDQGKTPEEALRESSPKLQARLAQAQKAASKKHLRSTAASGRDDAIDMDAINTFRRMNPKMSEKEAIELYKRVK